MRDMKDLVTNTLSLEGIDAGAIFKLVNLGDDDILACSVRGMSTAYKAWDVLRKLSNTAGVWPVVLGDGRELDVLRTRLSSSSIGGVNGIIKRSQELDVNNWMMGRALEVLKDVIRGHSFAEKVFTPHSKPSFNIAGNAEVFVGLLPTSESWKAAGFFNFGGWEDCPLPEEHSAMLRHWNHKYGVEVLSIFDDKIELMIYSPPSCPDSALQACLEILLYCPDHIPSSRMERQAYWAPLLTSKRWHFYWLNSEDSYYRHFTHPDPFNRGGPDPYIFSPH